LRHDRIRDRDQCGGGEGGSARSEPSVAAYATVVQLVVPAFGLDTNYPKLYKSGRNVHCPLVAPQIKELSMQASEQRRAHVLRLVTEALPESFWTGYQQRAQSIYRDAFSSVDADPRLNKSQRLSKLWQERHYQMEWLLINEAKANGVPASDTLIVENRCAYALAGHGGVKMTQKYVPSCGQMPSPAKFRKQLAAVNSFDSQPYFLFGDQPAELVLPSQLSGIVLHSPVGDKFNAEDQSLGSIGFYVPYDDFKDWAVNLTIAEIVAAYKPIEQREDRVKPALRVQESQKTGSKG
jgi:hypothetical protein